MDSRMSRKTIGGKLDAAALGALFGEPPAEVAVKAAVEHRPRDRREFIAAATDLLARGYSTNDAARALGITPVGVLELLRDGVNLPPDPFLPRRKGKT